MVERLRDRDSQQIADSRDIRNLEPGIRITAIDKGRLDDTPNKIVTSKEAEVKYHCISTERHVRQCLLASSFIFMQIFISLSSHTAKTLN